MASLYPTGLDALATDKTNATPALNDHAQHHDDLADAVNKIEAALGTTPNLATGLTVRSQVLTTMRPVSTVQAFGDRVFENNTNNGSSVAATFGVLPRLMNMLGSPGVVNFSGYGISSVNGNSLMNTSYSFNGNRMFSNITSATAIAGPYFSRGGLKLIQMCYNDYPSFGGTPSTAQNNAIENMLSVFIGASKASRRILPTDASITYNGGWVAGGSYVGGSNVTGTTYSHAGTNVVSTNHIQFATDAGYAGEPIDFYFYSPSTAVNLFQLEARLSPAGANTLVGSLDYQGFNATIVAAGKAGQLVLRIPRGSVPAGVQTIRINPVNITSSTNTGYFNGAIIEGKAPTVLPYYVNSDNVTAAAQVTWANARMAASAAQYDNTITTDPTSIINNSRYFSALTTLNDLGHSRLAQAIYESLGRVITTENASEMTSDVA